MAIKEVKKVAVDSTDIGGFNRSRYEKIEVAYGTVAASSYAVNDTIHFSDVPAKEIIEAKFVAPNAELAISPGTNLTNAIVFDVLNGGDPVAFDYVITYVRGGGETGLGNVIKLTIASSAT